MSSFQVLMPPTFINWLMNLRNLGQISSTFVFCTSVLGRDKETSNVNGKISTHFEASFRST